MDVINHDLRKSQYLMSEFIYKVKPMSSIDYCEDEINNAYSTSSVILLKAASLLIIPE